MVGDRCIADVQLAGNFLVAHALAYSADDLILPTGERGDSGLCRRVLGGVALHEGAEHTMGQRGIEAEVSPGKLSLPSCRSTPAPLLQQNTLCPVRSATSWKFNLRFR